MKNLTYLLLIVLINFLSIGCPSPVSTNSVDDADGDGVIDSEDICEGYDDSINSDNDNFPDGCDNCPEVTNHGQVDTDMDGMGDFCDPPIIYNVYDGVQHYSGYSEFIICIDTNNAFGVQFGLNNDEDTYGIETPDQSGNVCHTFRIETYGTYSWFAVAANDGLRVGISTAVEGTIIVTGAEQLCDYTGATDTDN